MSTGLEFQEFYDRSLSISAPMTVANERDRQKGDGGEGHPNKCPPRPKAVSRPKRKEQFEEPQNNVSTGELYFTPERETNEEPHSTMVADDDKESGVRSSEIEEESPFVCVKNELEFEDLKITPDLEAEDPLAILAGWRFLPVSWN